MLDAVSAAEFIRRLPLTDAAHLAATCRPLRKMHRWLFIKGKKIDFSTLTARMCRRVTDGLFQSVLSVVSDTLTALDVRGCFQSVLSVVSDTLTALDVRDCLNLTDEPIKAMNCPALTALDVSNTCITNEAIQAMNCPSLTALNISTTGIADEGIMAIAAGCLALTSLEASAFRTYGTW